MPSVAHARGWVPGTAHTPARAKRSSRPLPYGRGYPGGSPEVARFQFGSHSLVVSLVSCVTLLPSGSMVNNSVVPPVKQQRTNAIFVPSGRPRRDSCRRLLRLVTLLLRWCRRRPSRRCRPARGRRASGLNADLLRRAKRAEPSGDQRRPVLAGGSGASAACLEGARDVQDHDVEPEHRPNRSPRSVKAMAITSPRGEKAGSYADLTVGSSMRAARLEPGMHGHLTPLQKAVCRSRTRSSCRPVPSASQLSAGRDRVRADLPSCGDVYRGRLRSQHDVVHVRFLSFTRTARSRAPNAIKLPFGETAGPLSHSRWFVTWVSPVPSGLHRPDVVGTDWGHRTGSAREHDRPVRAREGGERGGRKGRAWRPQRAAQSHQRRSNTSRRSKSPPFAPGSLPGAALSYLIAERPPGTRPRARASPGARASAPPPGDSARRGRAAPRSRRA